MIAYIPEHLHISEIVLNIVLTSSTFLAITIVLVLFPDLPELMELECNTPSSFVLFIYLMHKLLQRLAH